MATRREPPPPARPAAPASASGSSGSSRSTATLIALPVGDGSKEVPMARLTAPVFERRPVRPQSIRFISSMRAMSSSFDDALLDDDYEPGSEEENVSPNAQDVWVRYGFAERRYARSRRRPAGSANRREMDLAAGVIAETTRMNGTGADRRDQPRRSSDPMDDQRAQAGDASGVAQARDCPAPQPNPSIAPSHSIANRIAIAPPPAQRPQQPAGPPSPDVGISTPPTVILTPSSQERHRKRTENRSNFTTNGVAVAAAAARNHNPNAVAPGVGAQDSLAAAFAASAMRSRTSSSALATEAGGAPREHEEGKEEIQHERDSPLDVDSLMAQGSDGARHGDDSWESSGHRSGSTRSSDNATTSGGSVGSGGQVRPANRHRGQRTIAEIERHKRNRAERLRAYGCARTLYPRIQPEPFSGSNDILEEVETQQWVETLRVTASIRGESLLAVCGASFAQHQAAAQLGERQAEARASRTADVSRMEGPDGLLHCAVLKGDHPLAARAAQFLVDKGGANVNSRDEWGRTPLHTASGRGIVSMARFFVRRGANIDARDQDDRTPLYFACAAGNTTMARYLTRMEVGARVDLRDTRGHLAGEFFWETISMETQEEIVAILVAAGWPDPLPPRRETTGSRGRRSKGDGRRRGAQAQRRSQSELSRRRRSGVGDSGSGGSGATGGNVGMKRLASEMKLLMRRR